MTLSPLTISYRVDINSTGLWHGMSAGYLGVQPFGCSPMLPDKVAESIAHHPREAGRDDQVRANWNTLVIDTPDR